MNEHLTPEKTGFCVTNFRHSTLLPAWMQPRGVSSEAEALHAIRCHLFYLQLIGGSLDLQ